LIGYIPEDYGNWVLVVNSFFVGEYETEIDALDSLCKYLKWQESMDDRFNPYDEFYH